MFAESIRKNKKNESNFRIRSRTIARIRKAKCLKLKPRRESVPTSPRKMQYAKETILSSVRKFASAGWQRTRIKCDDQTAASELTWDLYLNLGRVGAGASTVAVATIVVGHFIRDTLTAPQ